jgi:hypothetical protein
MQQICGGTCRILHNMRKIWERTEGEFAFKIINFLKNPGQRPT